MQKILKKQQETYRRQFEDALEIQRRHQQELKQRSLDRSSEARRLYEESLREMQEHTLQERMQRGKERDSEARRMIEEQLKLRFENQKKATDRLRIALERYRCIKV
jgi:hypothetical protein